MGNYRFSGHQTFVFRYGWLVKGVDLIRRNPHGFLEDDAIVQLGVGKNMVDSIKYWCVQTGLLEDDGGSGNMRLTEFAKSSPEIRRAALLACLRELEGQD